MPKKTLKIVSSDDENVILISDSDSKPSSSIKSSIEADSDYSSKASSSSSKTKNKRKLISYNGDEEGNESKKNVRKVKQVNYYNAEESDDFIESDEDFDPKPSTSKKGAKNRSKKNRNQVNSEDEDEPYEEKKSRKKNRIKEELINQRPIRKRTKTSGKKDEWIDDESHDSVSSCELDSDDKETVEKPIKINDEEILSFLNESTISDIQSLIIISDLKVQKLVSLRPFFSMDDMFTRLRENGLTHLSVSIKECLYARSVVNNLLEKCKQMSQRVKNYVRKITDPNLTDEQAVKLAVRKQPKILNKKMKLKPYQLTGLTWLCYMYEEKLNAVLADEMGLGKTCQTIAFLAYLHEINQRHMHLIVVPASTLENWSREISNWFPAFNFVIYRGSPDERREIRKDILKWRKKRDGPLLNAILTTYSYVSSNEHDKAFFRSIKLEYCIFDEAHCFKNMKAIKYQNLIKIKSKRKLLLTGTPLQNNIVELMSLLYFVTPNTFLNKEKYTNRIFLPNQKLKESDSDYNEKIQQARGIMEPFVLRRLKVDVLKELPDKTDEIIICEMTQRQQEQYDNMLDFYKNRRGEMKENNRHGGLFDALIELRKVANHPLLVRKLYTDEKINEMAHIILQQSGPDTRYDYVVEDMSVMNDFELHKLCPLYKGLREYELSNKEIYNSGKFDRLEKLLEEFKKAGDQVLIFSQFKIMLDIIEDFLKLLGHKFLRLDGSTKVEDRQGLIDRFNNDKSILVFMLTTKAGGVGINLTSANRVIIYDIDYNPHNDKQAEARCHRVGQKKDVQTYRLILKNSIDETMLKIQVKKLELDADIQGENHESRSRLQTMAMLKDVFN